MTMAEKEEMTPDGTGKGGAVFSVSKGTARPGILRGCEITLAEAGETWSEGMVAAVGREKKTIGFTGMIDGRGSVKKMTNMGDVRQGKDVVAMREGVEVHAMDTGESGNGMAGMQGI
jgi:hypothetical protein